MAVSWCLLLAAWMDGSVEPHPARPRVRLLVLGLLAFPWVNIEAQPLGWIFRLSGAWLTEHVFRSLGLLVERQGTLLLVQGLPISVEPACAGLGSLQAMLIAGLVVVHLQSRRDVDFAAGLAALPIMAWLANTARILTLSATALTFGPDFARSAFHGWAGWLALVLMFGLCCLLFSRAVGRRPRPEAGGFRIPARGAAFAAMFAFAAWSSAGLLAYWRDDRFGRAGGLALAVWLAPLVWRRARGPEVSEPLMIAGLALTAAGHMLSLHAFHYAGLALMCAALSGWRMRTLLWLPGVLVGLPVFGFLFQGAPAPLVAVLRPVLAAAFAAVLLVPGRGGAPPRSDFPQGVK